jgi:putative phosphoesterase
MKLGLIADIHADIRALETTLRWLDELGVEAILCAGDLVGYGSQPDEVVALVSARAIPCIRGNHDRWALERRQVIGLRGWKTAELADDTWQFLRALPHALDIELAGRQIAVHHGSPVSDLEFVSPYKPVPESVEQFWAGSHAQILILGHTHIPMIDRGKSGTIINPGSVMGVPGIQTSYSFAVLDLENLAVRIYEVRTGREIRRDPVFLDEEPR